MYVKLLVATGAAMVASAVPGHAQDQAGDTAPVFSGVYAGTEFGLVEHRFEIESTDPVFGGTDRRTFAAIGGGGGGFAGYDLAVAPRLRVGVEAAVTAGGGTAVARFDRGSYREDPQWGYRVGGRVGYVVGDRALLYAAVGYGAQRHDFLDGVGVDDTAHWNHSVSFGGGAEFRLSRQVGLRLDYRELYGTTRALTIGVPIRF